MAKRNPYARMMQDFSLKIKHLRAMRAVAQADMLHKIGITSKKWRLMASLNTRILVFRADICDVQTSEKPMMPESALHSQPCDKGVYRLKTPALTYDRKLAED